VLTVFVIIVTGILLQSTIFSQIKLLGVKPELLFLVTVTVAIVEGPREGMLVGFFAGMSQDFFLNQPKGITALTLTLLGYTVGLARQYVVSPSPLLPTVLVGVGTSAGVLCYEIVAFLLGQLDQGTYLVLKVALLSGAYGAVLTPVLFPVLRRSLEGSRPRRVVRF
jgi:rod shape-determining protein MreD